MTDQLPPIIYLHRIFSGDVPCEDIIWGEQKLDDEDVEYIRKDLYDKLAENYQTVVEELYATKSPERWNKILKELGI